MSRIAAISVFLVSVLNGCDTAAGPSPEDSFQALGYWSGRCDEDPLVSVRCGIITRRGNSWVRGLNDGETGPVSLDSAVLNQKYVRWGFYLRPQRVQAKLCYFHPAVSEWLCSWTWATYTATAIVPDSVDAGGYAPDQGDWVAIVTFFWEGRHRIILHAESDGFAAIDDTVSVRIGSDTAPPPPPPVAFAGVRGSPLGSRLSLNGVVVSELRVGYLLRSPRRYP